MAKIFILGENSFLGKSLFSSLKQTKDCKLVSREEINFLKETTFSNLDFSNSIIIDCINVNNGNAEEIMKCNYTGFTNFCNYLIKQRENIKYVYLSTISTISEETVKANAYVASKKLAEDFLIKSGLDYQIVRLSYPIGKGENKTRLISRMIDLLKSNQEIKIQGIQINLNDINDVCSDISKQILGEKIIFVSNNIYISLFDTIQFLKTHLNSTSNLVITESHNQFTPKSKTPFIPKHSIENTLLQMI